MSVLARADAPMNGLRPSRAAPPALALLAGAVGLAVAYGAPLRDVLLYLGYEGLFILLPGCLAFQALTSRSGGLLRLLAMGWALGYAMEGLAFVLAGAIGARSAFLAYPLVVGALVLISARRRGRSLRPGPVGAAAAPFAWAFAGVSLVAMAYIAVGFFPLAPLPGTGSFNYFQDYPWALSIAAEVKHHWPIEDASVAGEPFPYHWLVHAHWAAGSEVTGVGLPVVYFRLFILPLTAAITLQFMHAGGVFARSWAVGLLALCLVWFVGELQLDTTDPGPVNSPFLGVLFTLLVASPSFMYGLLFFVSLLALVGERLGSEEDRWGMGDLAILGLLALGGALAKVSILPILLAGLALYGAWTGLQTRRVPVRALFTALPLLAVSAGLYLALFRGHSSGLSLDPAAGFEYVTAMPAVDLIKDHILAELPSIPGDQAIVGAGALGFGLLGLMAAQLVGLVFVLRHRGLRGLDEGQRWLLTVLAAGLASLLLLAGGGSGNQLYGFFYGLAAGCLLSAQGLKLAWDRRPRLPDAAARLAVVGAGAAVLLLAVLIVPLHLGLGKPDRYLVWYGALAGLLALAYAAARFALPTSRWPAGAIVVTLLVLVGALDRPVDTLKPSLFDPPGETVSGRRVTPELYGALEWVRDNTPSDAVVAVNSYYTEIGPFEFVYGGFGERRVFLEGWGYSTASRDAGLGDVAAGTVMPFPHHRALNDAAFGGSSAALREMTRRYGVRYLIVDRVNGFPADSRRLRAMARVVHSDRGVTVFEVGPRGERG